MEPAWRWMAGVALVAGACGGAEPPGTEIPSAELAEPDAIEQDASDVPAPDTFEAQLAWGGELFAERCAGCHGGDEGGAGPALIGPGALPRERDVDSVEREDDFHTAADVLEFVSEEMPDTDPGSLAPQQYAAIVAYILYENQLGTDLGANDVPLTAEIADEIPLRR